MFSRIKKAIGKILDRLSHTRGGQFILRPIVKVLVGMGARSSGAVAAAPAHAAPLPIFPMDMDDEPVYPGRNRDDTDDDYETGAPVNNAATPEPEYSQADYARAAARQQRERAYAQSAATSQQHEPVRTQPRPAPVAAPVIPVAPATARTGASSRKMPWKQLFGWVAQSNFVRVATIAVVSVFTLFVARLASTPMPEFTTSTSIHTTAPIINKPFNNVVSVPPAGSTPHPFFNPGTKYNGAIGDNVVLHMPLTMNQVTSDFGWRRHPYPGMHSGLDLSAKTGTQVLAAADGVVEEAGVKGTYGQYIRIRHSDSLETAYAHMSSFDASIRPGAQVSQGKVIGYSGSSGFSTAPHLHFEVLENGKPVPPLEKIKYAGSTPNITLKRDDGTPRGIHTIPNNNPGGLEYHAKVRWHGLTGHNGRFAVFDTPENGLRAMAITLRNYQDLHGLSTIPEIVAIWAPRNENDVDKYIATVTGALGIPQNAELNLHDPKTMRTMLPAMMQNELGGNPYTDRQIDTAVKTALSADSDAAKQAMRDRAARSAATAKRHARRFQAALNRAAGGPG